MITFCWNISWNFGVLCQQIRAIDLTLKNQKWYKSNSNA